MFHQVSRAIVSRRLPIIGGCRRQFSVRAIYSAFPATLLYYSPHRRSSLYNHREVDSRPDDLYEEGVIVSQDGLVYPTVNNISASGGATMYPNTFLMQELYRRNSDQNTERKDEGKEVETPFIFTIPKGTPIPRHLILINEFTSKFSFQPSHGMSLKDLNQSLDEFYGQHALKETADSWLDNHPYHEAVGDDADSVWMSK